MNAGLWFRVSAVLLLLFAAGHTAGFLSFTAPTAEGRGVRASMDAVHFGDTHGTYSYGGFYRGFGLSITTSQLFSAWLAWFLAVLVRRSPLDASAIGWGLVGTQTVGVVLSVLYFSLIPAALSVVVGVTLAAGAIFARRVASHQR